MVILKTNTRTKTKNHSKKRLLLCTALAVVLLAGGGVAAALYYHGHNKPAQSSGSKSKASVDLSPPTNDQKQQGESTKTGDAPGTSTNNDSSGTSTPPATTGGLKQVTPSFGPITAANSGSGNGRVTGIVNGVVEDGGTCTFTFTLGSQHFSKQSGAFANAQNTNCTPLTIPCTDFGAACNGSTTSHTWSVVLTYSSSTSTGTSDAGSIEVYN